MRKVDVKIGDHLTVTHTMRSEPAGKCYHDGVLGCDVCKGWGPYRPGMTIEPGMVGVVVHVDCPSPTRNRSFLNIDFEIEGHTYRLRPWYDEVKLPART